MLNPTRTRLVPSLQSLAWERRKRRSTVAADALRFALDGAARRGELDAVFISDDFGMLVSQSDPALNLTEAAAIAPIVGRGRARATVRRAGHAHAMSVRTVRLLGEHLHVAAVGGNATQRRREITAAIGAARRILAA